MSFYSLYACIMNEDVSIGSIHAHLLQYKNTSQRLINHFKFRFNLQSERTVYGSFARFCS